MAACGSSWPRGGRRSHPRRPGCRSRRPGGASPACAAKRTEDLRRLVRDLTAASPDFTRHWENYQLHEHTHGIKRFHHETLGEIRVNYEALVLTADSGQTVIVYSADPGSPSAEKLQKLTTTPQYERIA